MNSVVWYDGEVWWFAMIGCGHPALDGDPSECAGCHLEVSKWAGSMHAAAHDDPMFIEAFERAQDPWCLECHAEPGVTCASCHQGEPTDCARCHQFDLPGTDLASQNTGREHAASSAAERPCHACHDPHRPDGGHDTEAVRRAIQVEVQPTPDGTRFELLTRGVGHAFPTGDPFRRLELQLCRDLACRHVEERFTLERRLQQTPSGWEVAVDTRIPAPTHGDTAQRWVEMGRGRAWKLVFLLADPRHPVSAGDRFVVDQGPVVPLQTEEP